jgi:hypothetical protein
MPPVLSTPVGTTACLALLAVVVIATTPCFHLTDCSGHGACNTVSRTCQCYAGWGHPDDIATYKAPDCSQRALGGAGRGGGGKQVCLLSVSALAHLRAALCNACVRPSLSCVACYE